MMTELMGAKVTKGWTKLRDEENSKQIFAQMGAFEYEEVA